MRIFILYLFLSASLIFTNSLFAGKDRATPHLLAPTQGFDADTAFKKEVPARLSKICTCQVLNLQSTNYHHKNIVVFAEKTNSKSWTSDVNRAIKIVEKEKKHLKFFFYKDLVVVNNITEAIDCKSLYAKLKVKNRSLVLYDILDADVRR